MYITAGWTYAFVLVIFFSTFFCAARFIRKRFVYLQLGLTRLQKMPPFLFIQFRICIYSYLYQATHVAAYTDRGISKTIYKMYSLFIHTVYIPFLGRDLYKYT